MSKYKENIPSIIQMAAFFKLFPIFILFVITCIACKQKDYYPEKHDEISEKDYQKYTSWLRKSYASNDLYEIAFHLASLRAEHEYIYSFLDRSVREQDGACSKIYEIKYLGEGGFYRHLYRYDTTKFNAIFEFCLRQEGSDGYVLFKAQKKSEELDYIASLPPLDSSLFNYELIRKLEVIYRDDQEYRKKRSRLENTKAERDSLWELVLKWDAVNLLRVDTILSVYGYPTAKEVSYAYNDVIFVVCHHIGDLELREHYYSRIKEHLDENQRDFFERRTNSIRESGR